MKGVKTMNQETLRRYRLIISLLVILLPIVFMIGVLSGQYDVINNQIVTNDTYKSGNYQVEYNGKTYYYYYQTSNNNIMDAINYDIDVACGSDPCCRDVFTDC